MSEGIWWAAEWRCLDCGEEVPIGPGQDTRPIQEAHECDPLKLKRAQREGREFGIEIKQEPHECVFVEEAEPNGRLILPPCIVCGLTAMDALDQLRREADR